MFVSSMFIVLALTAPGTPAAALPQAHPHQMQHDAEMKQHGAMAMGFDQDAATHHFRITDEGGAIEVTAKSTDDEKTRDAIRSHLREIAKSFAEGNFEKPMMTHGEEPDGVAGMKRLKADITYTYEELPQGGRVRISSSNADAIQAVHAFLRYQIREHHTGDPGLR